MEKDSTIENIFVIGILIIFALAGIGIISISHYTFQKRAEKVAEEQAVIYKQTKDFLTNCAERNGVYSEARTGEDERTMICSIIK